MMRDSKKIAADVYIPAGVNNAPVILIQTPYNRQYYRLVGLPLGIGKDQNNSPYIFVISDWRGFYGSSKSKYAGNPGLGEDGYDLVEWIAKQSWCNGKIGTWGPSALGKVQFQTASENPPSLTCICPLVAAPQTFFNDYYPGGCLRTEYLEQLDALGFGLSPIIVAHPYFDLTWSFSEKTTDYHEKINVPCLMIGGWYDHNVNLMLSFFEGLKKSSPVKEKHKLVMGPWVHGGSGISQVGTAIQGDLTYPDAAGWHDTFALRFFSYYLKGKQNNWESTPEVNSYQMSEGWQSLSVWPPSQTEEKKYFLRSDLTLSTSQPGTDRDSISFNYDPSKPSLTYGGPILRKDLKQGPLDLSGNVEKEQDVLIFTSSELSEDLIIQGSVKIRFQVSSDRTDTDFDVRLTDVYPDGRSIIFSDGARRMRFRDGNSSSEVKLMIPGTIYSCEIDLTHTALTLKKGHKIRIIVSSSNYPRFNRNMNTGAEMYPQNNMDSLLNPLIAKNTLHLGNAVASYILFPVKSSTSGIAQKNTEQPYFKIVPNPAKHSFNFFWYETEIPKQIVIHNMQGKLVHVETIHTRNTSISVSHLKTGTYSVGVLTSKGVSHQKLVLE